MATLGLSSQAPAVPGASVDGDIAAMVKDVSATPTATVVHDFPGTGPRVITILMSAAIHGLCEAIVPLVGAGAELDATDEVRSRGTLSCHTFSGFSQRHCVCVQFGWTALMHAAASGHLEVVTALLACKPDLQIKSTVDVRRGHLWCGTHLVFPRTDLTWWHVQAGPCAREGWDALAIALRARQCEIATLLIEATANVRVNYREVLCRSGCYYIADGGTDHATVLNRRAEC